METRDARRRARRVLLEVWRLWKSGDYEWRQRTLYTPKKRHPNSLEMADDSTPVNGFCLLGGLTYCINLETGRRGRAPWIQDPDWAAIYYQAGIALLRIVRPDITTNPDPDHPGLALWIIEGPAIRWNDKSRREKTEVMDACRLAAATLEDTE